ncbi:MAG: hypothetical protein VCD50_15330 [Alphaproteobacteria bacterium]
MRAMARDLNALPPAPAPTPPPAPPPRRQFSGNTVGLLLITCIVVVTAFLAFPTFIILACGLPPALAAALIDNRPGRHASYCVLSANLAGIVPALTALWFGGNTVDFAMVLLRDVYVWLEMYGTAALGWALIWVLVNGTEFSLELMARYRVSKLQAAQRTMVMEWGVGVEGRAADG